MQRRARKGPFLCSACNFRGIGLSGMGQSAKSREGLRRGFRCSCDFGTMISKVIAAAAISVLSFDIPLISKFNRGIRLTSASNKSQPYLTQPLQIRDNVLAIKPSPDPRSSSIHSIVRRSTAPLEN